VIDFDPLYIDFGHILSDCRTLPELMSVLDGDVIIILFEVEGEPRFIFGIFGTT